MSETNKECRLCACMSNEFTSLLADFDIEFPTYQAAILYCTGMLLSAEVKLYSQNICNECVKELITSVLFKKKCEVTYNLLQKSDKVEIDEKLLVHRKTGQRKYHKRIKTKATSRRTLTSVNNDFVDDRVITRSQKRHNSPKKELIVDDFGTICVKYKSEQSEEENESQKEISRAKPISNVHWESLDSVKLEQSEDSFGDEAILAPVDNCDDVNTEELPDLCDSMDDSLFLDDNVIQDDGNGTIPREKQMSRIKIVDEKIIIEKIPLAKIKHLAEKNFRERDNGKIECLLCGRVMTKSGRFLHYRQHLGPTYCDQCNKEYNTPQLLLSHMKRVHSGKVYVCDICGKSCKRPYHLSTHMLTHTGEKPHKCPHCGRGFVSKSNLLPHIKTHLGVRDFVCSVCGIGKTTRSELRFHMRIHNNTKPFKCEFCDYSAVSDYAVRRHARRHNPIKPYPCSHDGCQLAFTTAYDAKRHAEVHSKKTNYKCEHCHKGFHRRDALRRHLVSEHDIENPFQKKVNVLNQSIEDRMEVFKTIKTMMRGRMELEDKSVVEEFFKKSVV